MIRRPDTPPLITFDAFIRSRYSETDQMGYVYYGRYFEYFEQARTEMLRSMGLPYSQMEAEGVMLPVIQADIRYHRPVYYDEKMTVRVLVYDEPVSRIQTYYDVFSEKDSEKPSVTGYVELCFMDRERRRPVRAPERFLQAIQR